MSEKTAPNVNAGALRDLVAAAGGLHESPYVPQQASKQVPSVGSVVHYVSHGSPDGIHPAGEHRAALITAVPPYIALPDADQTVTLTVFNPNGFYVGAVAPYDPTAQQPGSWHWPEYVPAKG